MGKALVRTLVKSDRIAGADGRAEVWEHGRIGSVNATGIYQSYNLGSFSQRPHVIVVGQNADAQLAGTPNIGSFKVKLSAAGTKPAFYWAIGSA